MNRTERLCELQAADGNYRHPIEPASDCSLYMVDANDVAERDGRPQPSEGQFRLLVQGVTDYAIYMLGAEGHVLTWNAGAERIKGYLPGEIIGQHFSKFYTDEDIVIAKPALALETARRHGKYEEEGYRVRKDGARFWASIVINALHDPEGKLIGFAKITRNITDRKIEERSKVQFVTTINHELRTPLTSIKGSLAILKDGRISPGQSQTMINIAYNNCERLIALINDILDIDKIEAGQLPLYRKQLDVPELLAEAAQSNQRFDDRCKIEVDPTDDNLRIFADPARMQQALTNLISNAVKFSPHGSSVNLSARLVKNTVRISVTDAGAGIPLEFQNRIFTKFAQAAAVDDRRPGGTGLGLSITKAIVEAHGGTIDFATAPGAGTAFFFDLPEAGPLEGSQAATEKRRILVCEDDQAIAQSLKLLVEEAGFNADICGTLVEARLLLDQFNFLGMTLALKFVDGNGLAMLGQIRRTSFGNGRLPIIVVSPGGCENFIAGTAFEFVDCLDKSVGLIPLQQSIHHFLEAIDVHSARILHLEDDLDHQAIVAEAVGGFAQLDQVTNALEATELLRLHNYDLVIVDLDLADGCPQGDILPLQHPEPGNTLPAVIVYSINDLPASLIPLVDIALVKTRASRSDLKLYIQSLMRTRHERAAEKQLAGN